MTLLEALQVIDSTGLRPAPLREAVARRGQLRYLAAMNITQHTFDALEPATLYRVLKLRQDVFILEQRCLYPELDDLDQGAEHLLGWRGEALVAYLRVLSPGVVWPEAAIGRVVVDPAARGGGLGYELMRAGMRLARARWGGLIRIAAQAQLRAFYEELGFEVIGPAFDDEGIMHFPMRTR